MLPARQQTATFLWRPGSPAMAAAVESNLYRQRQTGPLNTGHYNL